MPVIGRYCEEQLVETEMVAYCIFFVCYNFINNFEPYQNDLRLLWNHHICSVYFSLSGVYCCLFLILLGAERRSLNSSLRDIFEISIMIVLYWCMI